MNPAQFQPGLSMIEFFEKWSSAPTDEHGVIRILFPKPRSV